MATSRRDLLIGFVAVCAGFGGIWALCPPQLLFIPDRNGDDTSGNSVVLEHIGGEINVHANPLGVMSNSPSFNWHMTNLI